MRSFLQQDMTSWVKAGTKPVFGVIRDFVDPALSEFIIKVIGEYAEIDAVDTKCGYACSDHVSLSLLLLYLRLTGKLAGVVDQDWSAVRFRDRESI